MIFPVCWRCAGFYSGILAQVLYVLWRRTWKGRVPEFETAIAAVIPAGVLYFDGVGNLLHLWNSPDWVRAASGAAMGLLVPLIAIPLLPRPGENDTRVIQRPAELWGGVILTALLLAGVARPAGPSFFQMAAVIPLLGLLLLAAGAGAIVISGLRNKGRRKAAVQRL